MTKHLHICKKYSILIFPKYQKLESFQFFDFDKSIFIKSELGFGTTLISLSNKISLLDATISNWNQFKLYSCKVITV